MFAPDAPGELGGEDLPNPDMLRRPTMRREAQSTSALEGTFEPLETVLAQDYEVGEDKSGLSESMREVLNYLDAAECHAAHRGCAFRAHVSRSRPGYSRPVACGLVEVT